MRVIFSCENAQEYQDLSIAMRALHEKHGADIIYFNLGSATDIDSKGTTNLEFVISEHDAIRVFKDSLKHLPPAKKLAAGLLIAIQLLSLCRKTKTKKVIIGVPLLPYRIARILSFGKIRFISIIRGVIAQSGEKTSLSSRLFLKLRTLGHLPFMKRILSDYYADIVICTGETTKNFLLSRMVPEKSIKTIGSIYCDERIHLSTNHKYKSNQKVIVFVSSAFAWHGDTSAQNEQLKLIKKINQEINNITSIQKIKLIIRTHPREDIAPYQEAFAKDPNIEVDDKAKDPFISYPSDALFVSPVSTLIFELAYLGRPAFLVADEFFLNHMRNWYQAIEATPNTNIKELINNYLTKDIQSPSYDNVISQRHMGSVVNEIVDTVLS